MRILYIDIDTLRADHLGCAGYHRNTTPNIDALAADGVRFSNVYASDVPCLPSRTALITGMFGIRNGVANHGGMAADLRPQGAERSFFSAIAANSWASRFYWSGYHTASISSFPFRHSATWWNSGFMESMNLMRGFGGERADQVLPGALRWLNDNAGAEDWFLHVHLWDPHTPYNAPADYGNPFEDSPAPEWHTEEVRARNWPLAGPHSAQEPWGFKPDEWGPPPPRQPWNLSTMDEVKQTFDGYDTGIRYADDAVGTLVNQLADHGVLDETAILVSSDHGEAFGELGVYADHQAADEATCHIPSVLRWPGIEPQVHEGLLYHLDVGATIVDLAGIDIPFLWDGVSVADDIRTGDHGGRESLVVSQGAWSVQRGVRWGDHLYLRTWHDGYHAAWNEEMLFDIASDPHETDDLAGQAPSVLAEGRDMLQSWTDDQMTRSYSPVDPLKIVLAEGGPFHCKGHLPDYLERLEATGRSEAAAVLRQRHPVDDASSGLSGIPKDVLENLGVDA
ncbi:MAG: sulfatase [Acidimicrobiia bacterium]|nr:sulfatase [Acidimicrobiia bacterium]MYB74300.1 sulfatase [Acidimicrobiia bacterium]MYH99117.1 sulfatase [Acidimicrobiia bacterium]